MKLEVITQTPGDKKLLELNDTLKFVKEHPTAASFKSESLIGKYIAIDTQSSFTYGRGCLCEYPGQMWKIINIVNKGIEVRGLDYEQDQIIEVHNILKFEKNSKLAAKHKLRKEINEKKLSMLKHRLDTKKKKMQSIDEQIKIHFKLQKLYKEDIKLLQDKINEISK